VGRIYGIFFLLFERAIQAAMPPAYHPETAHPKNAAWPTPSFPKVNTSKQLCSVLQFDRGIDFFAFRFSGQEFPTPDLGGPLDAGNIPSNRHFAVPDVIGFRSKKCRSRSGRASLMNHVPNLDPEQNREYGSKSS
jgi:hypothetical protein